jgi:hypothetical protein
MPPRPKVALIEDWRQIELLTRVLGQRAYELIRTVVLVGQSPAERAAGTGAAERTLYRQVARFGQLGMASFVPPPKVEKHRLLPAEARQAILDAKREHPLRNVHELRTLNFRQQFGSALAGASAPAGPIVTLTVRSGARLRHPELAGVILRQDIEEELNTMSHRDRSSEYPWLQIKPSRRVAPRGLGASLLVAGLGPGLSRTTLAAQDATLAADSSFRGTSATGNRLDGELAAAPDADGFHQATGTIFTSDGQEFPVEAGTRAQAIEYRLIGVPDGRLTGARARSPAAAACVLTPLPARAVTERGKGHMSSGIVPPT